MLSLTMLRELLNAILTYLNSKRRGDISAMTGGSQVPRQTQAAACLSYPAFVGSHARSKALVFVNMNSYSREHGMFGK